MRKTTCAAIDATATCPGPGGTVWAEEKHYGKIQVTATRFAGNGYRPQGDGNEIIFFTKSGVVHMGEDFVTCGLLEARYKELSGVKIGAAPAPKAH